MSFAIPQTPQRPLPGAYLQTPSQRYPQPQHSNFGAPPQSSTHSQGAQTQSQALTQQPQYNGQVSNRPPEDLKPVERASKAINDALHRESQFPELDAYITQGVSSDYDVFPQTSWTPFQRVKVHDVPEKIFDQYNRAQMATMMGLFADLNHAWVSIDNALYLWNYTLPDPPLIGFEEQTKQITAVELGYPRAGVFVPTITRMLIIATTSDIYLLGLASQVGPSGSQVSLYSTGMSVSIKGIEVSVIATSRTTGRVFFAGKDNDDILELTYQQEEGWFSTRCSKINHTGKGLSMFAPTPLLGFGPRPVQEHIVDLVVDDSRSLLYSLSSRSTIRVFYMSANNGLSQVISRPLGATLRDISHMPNTQSDLLTMGMSIIAIEPIPSREAAKMHLMATTSTGCRIYMSATSSSSFYVGAGSSSSSGPNSMQVQHVKFPPSDSVQQSRPQQPAPPSYTQGVTLNINSRSLVPARKAKRFPPGAFFCFVQRDPNSPVETVFVSSPDSGRIARPPNTGPPRFPELGMWLNLDSPAEAIGSIAGPFSAGPSPRGFANELAIQFDEQAAEIAILTNTGVQTYRKRRLVDIFASVLRLGGGDEGLEAEIRKFISRYGRTEIASTALAVACGQGLDVMSDSRVANITDPQVLEFSRKAFIEYGGKAQYSENNNLDQSAPAIDMVQLSARHDGVALYISRLVRSIWKSRILQELISPTSGLIVTSPVPMSRLQSISQDLIKLRDFLNSNKSFIEGLSGPEALGRASTKQDEIALQAEHRALHAQLTLIHSMIEGIAFIQVLFDERLSEIVFSLSAEIRAQVRSVSYEQIFCSVAGRELAKELVKAIVNRNIASGSNVETVADALRRRCGTFCSADDVVIFKAQEQLKRASEAGENSELSRNVLNESLRLFTQVSGSLSMEQLQWAINSFANLQFYAGAIQLALSVAHESDRGKRALSWIEDGRPENDSRQGAFEARKRCYNLIHAIIRTIEDSPANVADGQYSLAVRRRNEAFEVIDTSEDEAFHTDLYDWYLSEHKEDRLLEVQSPYIITYLERRSGESVGISDLLWRYHSRIGHNHEAAEVQLKLARSPFNLNLDRRIEYLSRAKANASMPSPGVPRQDRYQLLRDVSDLLDIANIQSDLCQRLINDDRVSPDRRPQIAADLDGQLQSMDVLYNQYADQANYYDLCILIYQAADHRNPADIRSTWANLIDFLHDETVQRAEGDGRTPPDRDAPKPYEVIAEKVRSLGTRLNLSETMFPVPDILPLLEKYAFTMQRHVGPPTWVIDSLAQIGVPFETLFPVLEGMFYNDEQPFHGRNRKVIAEEIIYVVTLWIQETSRGKERMLGGEHNAEAVSQMLLLLQQSGGLDPMKVEEAVNMRQSIESMLR